MPKISICIPAYKRTVFLKRLLDSILQQSFRDYEVIVSDDSPDESVKLICAGYMPSFPLKYYKNENPEGTPGNWNRAIETAEGEWIKLMHDDDWFSSGHSLQQFADATQFGKKLIFSAYTNVFEKENREEVQHMTSSWKNKILDNPDLLLARNVIGPPSVSLIHETVREQYDILMKWRVDIDFYIRMIRIEKEFTYLNVPLIKVGISNSQVTNSCIGVPEVELPEGFLLIKKNGLMPLRNLRVYDAWWRIIRNVGIRKPKELNKYTPDEQWPAAIRKIVQFQSHIPVSFLKFGPASKILMFISFVFNFHNLSSHK